MKQLLPLLFSCFISCLSSFYIPTQVDEDIRLTEILDAPGVDKDDLYVYVNSWMTHTFVSREGVIEFEDKEYGKTIAKFLLSNDTRMVVDFDIRDEVIKMSLIGTVKTYENTEENIEWKEKRMKAGLPTGNQRDYAIDLWRTLVESLVEYINEIDENW